MKRSLLTEGQGVPIGLAGANRHDMKLVSETITRLPAERPEPTQEQPQHICLDKGYDYDEVRATLLEFGFTAHIRARGEEAQELKRAAGKRAHRWVVEIVCTQMTKTNMFAFGTGRDDIANLDVAISHDNAVD